MAKTSHAPQVRKPAIAGQEQLGNQVVPMNAQGEANQNFGQLMQMKRDAQNFPSTMPQRMNTLQRPPQGLPQDLQPKMESALGTDLSSVKVHTDSAKAQEMGAHAYTQGDNVHFAPGQYDSGSQKGQELIGHELSHVVQQRQGRVQPTVQMKGVGVNADSTLEKEADEMGKKAAQGKAATGPIAAGGGGAGDAGPIQMAVNPMPLDYRDYANLSSLTVDAFENYAQAQADWHASTKLSDAEVDILRTILAFSREEGNASGLRGLVVADIQAQILLIGQVDALKYLRHYSKAVQGEPFQLTSTAVTSDAVAIGKSLNTLKGAFPNWVLNSAMYEEQFNQIKDNNLEADLVKYYTTSLPQPYFQALDGEDFRSYYLMRTKDKKNPLDYNKAPMSGRIRNYHRFKKDALNRLETNFGVVGNKKPVTLIMHTALSDSSAFHREEEFTNFITSSTDLVLMLEGKSNLEEMGKDIPKIAQDYGPNGKIDQIMVAGHGNANSTQQAGAPQEDPVTHKLEQRIERLNPIINLEGSKKLMKVILDNMDKKGDKGPANPHNRIMFNACLTASHDFTDQKFDADPTKARKEISTYLSTPRNLVDWMEAQAKANGNDTVKGVGSVASFTTADYLDSKGNLDIISAKDPKVTGTKLEYIEVGIEALGALRAVMEAWALKEADCKTAMQKRMAKPVKDWDGVIIQDLYAQIINSYWRDANKINRMTSIAGVMAEMKDESKSRVSMLDDLPATEPDIINPLFTALSASNEWGANSFIPLVMYQGWLKATATTQASALAEETVKVTASDMAQKAQVKTDADLAQADKDLKDANMAEAAAQVAAASVPAKDTKKQAKAKQAVTLAQKAQAIATKALDAAKLASSTATFEAFTSSLSANFAGLATFTATIDHNAKRDAFLTHLETKFNCNTSNKYIDVNYLDNNKLFPFLLAGPATKGRLMLALIGMKVSNQADCKAYLETQLAGGSTFPAALKVNDALAKWWNEDEILIAMGKKSAPPTAKNSGSSPPVIPGKDANMPLKGGAKNTEWIQSVTLEGKSSANGVKVYQEEAHTTEVGTLKKDEKVRILGNLTNDWAIEWTSVSGKAKTRGTGFVKKSEVKQV